MILDLDVYMWARVCARVYLHTQVEHCRRTDRSLQVAVTVLLPSCLLTRYPGLSVLHIHHHQRVTFRVLGRLSRSCFL